MISTQTATKPFAMGWGFLSHLAQGKAKRYAYQCLLLRQLSQNRLCFVFDYHYQTGSGKKHDGTPTLTDAHARVQKKSFRN